MTKPAFFAGKPYRTKTDRSRAFRQLLSKDAGFRRLKYQAGVRARSLKKALIRIAKMTVFG